MATNLSNTNDATQGNLIALYGASGVGKTSLLPSFDRHAKAHGGSCLQIDFDKGNLAIKEHSIVSVSCDYLADLYDVLGWCESADGWKDYTHLFIDGATVMAEGLLNQHLQLEKDPRQAYGKLASQFTDFIYYLKRSFSDKIIVVTFQERYVQDSDNKMIHSPDLPGKKLPSSLSYKFDEVFCLRVVPDAEGKPRRQIQAQPDMQYDAKDRSGKLPQFVEPDLQLVLDQITV